MSLLHPTHCNLLLSQLERKFPLVGVIAQLNNHHAPMKAVINVYPLNSLLVIQNEHYKQKQSVWLIMWLQIIWRVGTYLHFSSATHKIITNLSKVIIFSLAIRKLFCLIFFAFSSQEDTWISITSLRDAKNKTKIGKVKEIFQSIYLLLEFGGKK